MLLAAAIHPNATDMLLEELGEHPNPYVQRAARLQRRLPAYARRAAHS
jgi:hypothetical protein